MSKIPVAVQLYTIRDASSADFPAALRKVAAIGYKAVEFAGFNGFTPAQIKPVLDELNLTVVAAHVGFDGFENGKAEQTFADYKAIGCPFIVIPYLVAEKRVDAAAYKQVAKDLNELAKLAKVHGIKIGYHNHDFEFNESFDGKRGIEILIEETDPEWVKFELDTYWALFAGVDPVEFMAKYPGRFSLLHIKDMDKEDRTFAEVGTGLLPVEEIIAAAPAAGATALIVEQDRCKRDPMESIEISYKYMKAKGHA
jgi:sugar phosphate isomerase/epimerase